MKISTVLKAVVLISLWLAIDGPASADTPAELVGTWSVVLVDNISADGSRVALYGDHPEGLLMFDRQGRYSLQLLNAERVKFAQNDKSKGTPEEIKAAVEGANSHFGHYSVDPDKHTITFRIEHASFPNWDGTVQVRSFNITGDRLTYTVPNPTTDQRATGEVVWERLR